MLHLPMLQIPFHADRRKGTRGTHIFARAAAYAALKIHSRPLGAVLPADQGNRAGRTRAGTGGTFHLVRRHDATLAVNNRPAYLDCAPLRLGNRPDGACRADLGTGHAIHAAKAPFKGQGRHQHGRPVVNGAQHLIGTGRHAEPASGAAFHKSA